MKPITVKELATLLTKISKDGFGDYVLLVSDDEECNGFHALYDKTFYLGDDMEYLNHITKKHETAKTITIA